MSMIIGKALIAGGGTVDRLDFTYTGQYNERLEDGVVELLSTGILKVKRNVSVDVFLVGGGSAGGSCRTSVSSGGGGAGGHTKTFSVTLYTDTEYHIEVGAGGAHNTGYGVGGAGGSTSAFGATVNGGSAGARYSVGANGGSGGGGAEGGAGGSDGSNGSNGSSSAASINPGGTGQGITTREFGEATGKLYAGGGSAGNFSSSATATPGGAGGGGDGGDRTKAPTAGSENTGGGGGGGSAVSSSTMLGADGGSGIVCIRLHKEA